MSKESKSEKAQRYALEVSCATAIAQPMASLKLCKKIFKLIKAARNEKLVLQGTKALPKYIMKSKGPGIVVIGGNVTPIDLFSHLPLLCEEKDIPYCYVPSKDDIGAAFGSASGLALIMIQPSPKYEKLYNRVLKGIASLPITLP